MVKVPPPAALPTPAPQQVSNGVVPFDKQGTAPLKQCGTEWPFPKGTAPPPGGTPFKQ